MPSASPGSFLRDLIAAFVRAIALLTLLGGAPARAVVMYTPPVDCSASDRVACQVLNLGDTPVVVTAALRNDVDDLIDDDIELIAPGGAATVVSTLGFVPGASCVFEFEGDPTRVRPHVRISEEPSGLPLLQAAAYAAPPGLSLVTQTFTAPVRHINGNGLQCRARNDSANTVSVTALLHDETGAVVAGDTIDVPPGESRTLVSSFASILGAYCRFTFNGSPTQVRGFLTLRRGLGITTGLSLAASPPTAPARGPVRCQRGRRTGKRRAGLRV